MLRTRSYTQSFLRPFAVPLLVASLGCAVDTAEQKRDDIVATPEVSSSSFLNGSTSVDIKTTAVSGVVYHEKAADVQAVISAVSERVGSSPVPNCAPDLVLTFRRNDMPVAIIEVACGNATTGKNEAQLISTVSGRVGSVEVDLDILNKYAPSSWKVQRPPQGK